MDYKTYLYGLVWMVVWSTTTMRVASQVPTKCHYTREFRLRCVKCGGMNLVDIPNNLNTDIELLYAPDNRIRDLTNTSLRVYDSLKLLYLANNFIKNIEEGAFSELSNLEVLDLTHNFIRNMPKALPLPLRTLYLAENDELSQNLSLSSAYNLALLSMAKCQLTNIPPIGVLPNLKDLNMTLNPLKSVTPADLAPLCRLERLYLPPTLYKSHGSECQCHQLITWTSQHYITLPGFNCTGLTVDPDTVDCNMNFSAEAAVHKDCLALEPPPTTARYLVMSIVVGVLLLICLVIACWWRKGRRKQNTVEDNRRVHHNAKAADTLIM